MKKLFSLFFSLLLFLTPGCGFKAVYSKNNDFLYANVMLEENATEIGKKFDRQLNDLIKLAASKDQPKYKLIIDIKSSIEGSLIEKTSLTSRSNIVLFAHYLIVLADNNQKVQEGDLRVNSGYNISDAEFAAYVSEETASKNAIRELAEEIRKILLML